LFGRLRVCSHDQIRRHLQLLSSTFNCFLTFNRPLVFTFHSSTVTWIAPSSNPSLFFRLFFTVRFPHNLRRPDAVKSRSVNSNWLQEAQFESHDRFVNSFGLLSSHRFVLPFDLQFVLHFGFMSCHFSHTANQTVTSKIVARF
jgi:hypothetical protein